jgi:hypothetical protein
MPSDDELLDFDMKELGDLQTAPRTLLQQHGDTYREHLLIARSLEGWSRRHRRFVEGGTTMPGIRARDEGVIWTLEEVAIHLRQGSFLPGGALYDVGESR